MKKITIIIFVAIILILALPVFAEAKTTRARGYFKSNGTYVQPYYKTSPNKTKFDNYSSKYNYNPFTGKKGTVDPFKYKFKY